MLCHKHTTAAGLSRALLPETRHLVVVINFVELEDGKLHFLVLVLLLLWLCVGLLLAFFASTKKLEILEQSSLLEMKTHRKNRTANVRIATTPTTRGTARPMPARLLEKGRDTKDSTTSFAPRAT